MALADTQKKNGYKERLKVLLPYGMLATKKWLASQGLSNHALDNAVKTKTLLLLTSGVYSQYSRSIRWEGVIASLQRMEKASVPAVHVGGISALSLSGVFQYLPLGNQVVSLYTFNKLPAWLSRLSLDVAFKGYSVKTLWPESLMADRRYLKEYEWDNALPPVYYSCPEKAILELLTGVPENISFEHADELMQGLVNLSPRKLDGLLQACRNVKAKRLFFWLAARQNYSWFGKLNRSDYDFGSGKRVVATGGKLDKDYLITVPAHMTKGNRDSIDEPQ
ncbi:type IV toxin-antitoxin system AbiEi family antitoxin domain-containing protein [uncultured Amphritea sp.]|uniref:type IV toxin-antitoxin system AbiEi family antitoxin domain-containing protein n=1 Tax=uncultured Amphritea sp. TaxID=981605 RepID=UPI0026254BD9|nr:type IV toxin-antitoxin system AbiEi family antitoxin domain-containing protein [uncultured Amphritea sp.]